MDLTPERRQQIEEEERQRLAEEQYRAQIRANLTANPQPSAMHAAEPEQRSSAGKWLLGVVIVFLVIFLVLVSNRRNPPAAAETPTRGSSATPARMPSIRYVPVSQKLASGQIVVRAGGYIQYRCEITPDMRNAHVSGRFNAAGGTGNDIEAVIATEEEFTNWVNGHQARVFYSTQGRKTTDTIDVRLAPGTYYLAFNNRFSTFSAKDVFLEVDLDFQRLETN